MTRIRKQPRKASDLGLPVEYPVPTILKQVEVWGIQQISEERDNDGMSDQIETIENSRKDVADTVEVHEGHVVPGYKVEKLVSQARPVLGGSARVINGMDSEVEREQVAADSARLIVDTAMAMVDQKYFMKVSDSTSHGETTQEDDNTTTRHYVRRSLRKTRVSGRGSVLNTSQNEELNVAPYVPKAEVDKSVVLKHFRSGQLPFSGVKTEPVSPGGTCKNTYTRAEPCYKSEDCDHPSQEPEGSLLHSLYLQLLAAGREGITLKELFASFASQTSLPQLESNWKEQVKTHLKKNPYFEEVKGRYLLCELLVESKSKIGTKTSLKRNDESPGFDPYDMGVNPRTPSVDLERGDPACSQSVPTFPRLNSSNDSAQGVQTRRKAYQKTIEAVLNESAREFYKLLKHNSKSRDGEVNSAHMIESSLPELNIVDPKITEVKSAPVRASKKRKSSDVEAEMLPRNIRFGGAIPGTLKAMQAKIVAETGIQNGVRCARKDGSNDSSKWQCPMMAMEGHTLCEHHNFLNERKKARYAKAKRQGEGTGKRMKRDGDEVGSKSQAAKNNLKNSLQTNSRSVVVECNKEGQNMVSESTGLDEVISETLLIMKGEASVGGYQTDGHTNGPSPFGYKPQPTTPEKASSKMIEDPMIQQRKEVQSVFPEKAMPQFSRSPVKGKYVAAKKNATKSSFSSNKEKSPERQSLPTIRAPVIPPLPMQYGMRRKTVKNRSLLSLFPHQ